MPPVVAEPFYERWPRRCGGLTGCEGRTGLERRLRISDDWPQRGSATFVQVGDDNGDCYDKDSHFRSISKGGHEEEGRKLQGYTANACDVGNNHLNMELQYTSSSSERVERIN